MDEYILFGKWFNSDRLYNPFTKRKIKKDKKTYKKVLKIINSFIDNNNKFFYIKKRLNKICPFSMEVINNGFNINNIWNPFSGQFLNTK